MSNIKYNKIIERIQDAWSRFKLACLLPDHFMFIIYERIAGELECKCCVFWRGVIFGILIQCLVIVIALVLGVLA